MTDKGAIQNAKYLYDLIFAQIRHEGEDFSWIIKYCLMPIGGHLEKLGTSLQ